VAKDPLDGMTALFVGGVSPLVSSLKFIRSKAAMFPVSVLVNTPFAWVCGTVYGSIGYGSQAAHPPFPSALFSAIRPQSPLTNPYLR